METGPLLHYWWKYYLKSKKKQKKKQKKPQNKTKQKVAKYRIVCRMCYYLYKNRIGWIYEHTKWIYAHLYEYAYNYTYIINNNV